MFDTHGVYEVQGFLDSLNKMKKKGDLINIKTITPFAKGFR